MTTPLRGIDVAQAIAVKAHRLEQAMNAVLRPTGLTKGHWFILCLLETQDTTSMSEISIQVGTPAATATRFVDHIIDHGYAYRVMDQEDRRRSLVVLSERGRDLLTEWSPAVEASLGQELRGLSEAELRSMTQALATDR